MTKLKILALMVGLVMLFAIPATVSAQRVPPHVFVGSTINGAAATDGTVIAAMVNDVQVATATVVDGNFVLVVDQGDEIFAGMMVHFTVDGADAAETPAWVQGGGTEVSLTMAAPAQATATPEPVATVVPGSGQGGAVGAVGSEGPQGPQGARGARGSAGADGADGSDGSGGARGSAGADGQDGADGAAGSDGSGGSTGSAGPAGSAGVAGAAGEDGGSGLGIVALILAIIAIVIAGGAVAMGRRS